MNQTESILNFHGIGSPHSGIEAAERPYWISELFFQQILNLVDREGYRRRVLWTFDDGNASDLSIAAPRLAAASQKGTFFILTGRFDNPHYLSPAQTRGLADMGMEIGLHGRDHVDWRTVSVDLLNVETIGARGVLAQELGRPVTEVAIPFGTYNRRVISHLKACGFNRIYTSDHGPAAAGETVRNRTSVRADMTLEDVRNILDNNVSVPTRARRWLSRTLRRYVI